MTQETKVTNELQDIILKKERAMRDNALSIRNLADDISLIDSNSAVKALNGIIQYIEGIKNSL
jgi:hypothetical protein